VASIIGDRLGEDISVEQMMHELETRYDTYFILPNMTSYYNDPNIHGRWLELLGQKAMRLDDPSGVSELIAATIGLAEGVVDVDAVYNDLADAGRGAVSDAVATALVPVASTGPHGPRRTMPATGPGAGLTWL
jgi:hypothetical protein